MRPCDTTQNRLRDHEIMQAVMAIKKGGIVAVPTETYYGLAADPLSEKALRRIFELKQRPESKPVLILISDLKQLDLYAESVPDQYKELMQRYWPGPLTLVFPARASMPNVLTAGTGTVGIRLTPHPLTRKIIEILDRPITATSANISGHEPARSVEQVMMMFGDRLDCIVDGGTSTQMLPSTVVRVEDGRLQVVRPGLADISL